MKTHKTAKKYRYRGLPITITNRDRLWCVCGTDSKGGGGVLEWCYDESDARAVMADMLRDVGRFSNLSAEPWSEGTP